MSSLVFNALLRHEAVGAVDFDTDTFYAMLVGVSYTPNKDTHDYRDDVSNEITGTGYTAGGSATAVTVGTVDTVNDRVDITFAQVTWPSSTITAYGAVYYKRRGGSAAADELVGFNDFGGAITTTGATFTLPAATLRKQN